jgi:hypothetical protein
MWKRKKSHAAIQSDRVGQGMKKIYHERVTKMALFILPPKEKGTINKWNKYYK